MLGIAFSVGGLKVRCFVCPICSWGYVCSVTSGGAVEVPLTGASLQDNSSCLANSSLTCGEHHLHQVIDVFTHAAFLPGVSLNSNAWGYLCLTGQTISSVQKCLWQFIVSPFPPNPPIPPPPPLPTVGLHTGAEALYFQCQQMCVVYVSFVRACLDNGLCLSAAKLKDHPVHVTAYVILFGTLFISAPIVYFAATRQYSRFVLPGNVR